MTLSGGSAIVFLFSFGAMLLMFGLGYVLGSAKARRWDRQIDDHLSATVGRIDHYQEQLDRYKDQVDLYLRAYQEDLSKRGGRVQ